MKDKRWLHWLLRVAVAGEFIGHGAFGLMQKAAWLPYLQIFGLSRETAFSLMPMIGTIDILVGISVLFCPLRPVVAYAAFWGLATAAWRPICGESIFEFVERAANWAVPAALYVEIWGRDRRWISRWLRVAVVGMLIGHAGFGLLLVKQNLQEHLASIGIQGTADVLLALGIAEACLALCVLLRPSPRLLVAIAMWKLATESLYVTAGSPAWEVIERFGSILGPLALIYADAESDQSH